MRKRSRQWLDSQLPVPAEDRIIELSNLLEKQISREEICRRYAPVKHILALLGAAGAVSLLALSPAAAGLAKEFIDEEKRKKYSEWKRYNPSYLRSSLKRLRERKYITITTRNGEDVIELADAGKRRIIKYALDDLSVDTPKEWDGRWRMIIYDVENGKKRIRDVFREAVRSLGFLMLQESVWLFPYPCEKQVTFLKEYYGVGNEVLYIVAITLEDDAPYREYFGVQ